MISRLLQKKFGRTGISGLVAIALCTALLAPSTAHADFVSSVTNFLVGSAGYLFGAFLVPIAFALLTLSTFILWVAGLVFNWAIIRTVYQFGTYFGTSSAMLTAWGIMRDVANIGLLFGFIFMGVLLILNVEGGGHGHGGGISAKKAIPRLIIFAVLLNFSLFTTQAVIDVSNGLASTFATQAGQVCEGGAAEDCVNSGISGLISYRAGVFSIWSANGLNVLTDPLKSAVVYIGLSIFLLITAMVLIAGAIMFVYRAVVLSFLMITSPIGFAGMAIPSLGKIGKEWWDKLISQAFFAPVYLLLIFVSLKLTETLSQGSSGQSLASALTGTGGGAGGAEAAGNIQIVLVFAVVIGFMIASLVSANKFGAMGAKFATQTAGSLTIGTAGFVGRRTLGRASRATAERIRGSQFGATEWGRKFAGIADKGAKSSFDFRGTSAAGALSKQVGDLGTAQKGGFAHDVHEAAEARKKHAESMTLNRDERHEVLNARLESRRLQQQIDTTRAQVAAGGGDAAAQAAAVQPMVTQREGLQARIGELNQQLFERREQYAQNVDTGFLSNTLGQVTGGRAYDEEGAHEIREWLAESPQQRLIRQMGAANPPAHPPAAPAAQPPAGGGAHPPAGGAPAAH